MRKHFAGFLASALICGAATIQAATISIPADHATINAAVTAANPGDTIVINETKTFDEFLRLRKPVTITAGIGFSPTINSATTTTLILFTGSGGSQFGSLAGGRLTISNTNPILNAAVDTVTISTSSSTPVVFENVNLEGGGFAGDIVALNGLNTSAIFRNSTLDGKNRALRGYWASYQTGSTSGTLVMERVKLKGTTSFTFWNYSGASSAGWATTPMPSTIDIRFCEIDGRSAFLGNGRGNYTTMLLNRNSRPMLTMEDSIVYGAKSCLDMFWSPNAAYNHSLETIRVTEVKLNRNVFVQPHITQTTQTVELSYAVLLFGPMSRYDVKVDHCDVVVLGANAKRGVELQVLPAGHLIPASSYRKVSVTNTNIVTPGPGLVAALTAGSSDAFVSNYNNIFTTGAAYTSVTPGVKDLTPALDPGYTNVAIGDVRYANNTVKRAGEGLTAIGVNASYADVIAGIVAGTPGVSRASHWSILN